MHYDFWDFLRILMRIMQSENSATDIHAHYRQSETAPPYTRIICEENFAQIYIRIAVRSESAAIDWRWHLGVCLCRVLYMRSSFEEGCFC